MSSYYCWEQYYDPDTLKQTNSDEIKYYQGHQHGVQPNPAQWAQCLASLVAKVNQCRQQNGLPDLPVDTISQGAEKKTRSAH